MAGVLLGRGAWGRSRLRVATLGSGSRGNSVFVECGQTRFLVDAGFSGSEADALRRYKETRNGLLGADYSSKFSPWLANGALSPRTILAEVRRYEAEGMVRKFEHHSFQSLILDSEQNCRGITMLDMHTMEIIPLLADAVAESAACVPQDLAMKHDVGLIDAGPVGAGCGHPGRQLPRLPGPRRAGHRRQPLYPCGAQKY